MVEGIGRPLGQAQVGVVGLPMGTQSNEAGDYRLTGVPAGPRQVRVQRLGFAPSTQQVTVVAGQTVTLDFTIREAPVALEQVVVTATGDVRKKEIAHLDGDDLRHAARERAGREHAADALGAVARRHSAGELRAARRGRS